jgi:hypothetical protein
MTQTTRGRLLMQADVAACTLVLLLAAAAPAFAADITVEQPSMRFIIKARPAAGYFTLNNATAKPVELTGASSSACGMLMLHQSTQEKGVEKMRMVDKVPVPAHGTVSFAPGGYHLMCMNPKMNVGDTVPVTLTFAGGEKVTAQFPVKGPGGQ